MKTGWRVKYWMIYSQEVDGSDVVGGKWNPLPKVDQRLERADRQADGGQTDQRWQRCRG